MTDNSKRGGAKERDAWSTVLLFDPFAVPLTKFVGKRVKLLKPDHLTFFAVYAFIVALVFLFKGMEIWAIFLIFLSTLFDCMDGKLARASNINTKHGKFVDAGADFFIHSFGFLAISYWYFQQQALISSVIVMLWSLYFGVMHINAIMKMTTPPQAPVENPKDNQESKWVAACRRFRLIPNPVSDVDMAFVIIPVSILAGGYSAIILVAGTVSVVFFRNCSRLCRVKTCP